MPVAAESCYIYLRLPKHLADGRPTLPEEPSDPHITMLYVGKVSQATYWRIVEGIRWWRRAIDDDHRVTIEPIVQFFGHVPTEKDPYSDIAYAPVDGDLEGLHYNLRTMLVPKIVKQVKHVSGDDGFIPHVTLQHLYGKQRTNKRVQAKLEKLANAISGSWSIEMLHVDWGDVHRVAVTLNGTVYQER